MAMRQSSRESRLARGAATFKVIIIITASMMLVLPFITTFNEFLTAVVARMHLDTVLVSWAGPTEARLIGAILRIFNIDVAAAGSSLHLNSAEHSLVLYISWNCIGWQSFIMLAITLLIGLRGPYTASSKVQCLLIGLLGTFLVNLFRMAAVGLVGFYHGEQSAILFHDYGGTMLTILWLVGFWLLAYCWVLETHDEARETAGVG